jgi:hypothetical protein
MTARTKARTLAIAKEILLFLCGVGVQAALIAMMYYLA